VEPDWAAAARVVRGCWSGRLPEMGQEGEEFVFAGPGKHGRQASRILTGVSSVWITCEANARLKRSSTRRGDKTSKW
jgi:hypothetical protein